MNRDSYYNIYRSCFQLKLMQCIYFVVEERNKNNSQLLINKSFESYIFELNDCFYIGFSFSLNLISINKKFPSNVSVEFFFSFYWLIVFDCDHKNNKNQMTTECCWDINFYYFQKLGDVVVSILSIQNWNGIVKNLWPQTKLNECFV